MIINPPSQKKKKETENMISYLHHYSKDNLSV